MKVYLRHVESGRLYEVVSMDPEKQEITLRGPLGTTFTEPYSKERLQALGYKMEQHDE